jgi:hypothetical protein
MKAIFSNTMFIGLALMWMNPTPANMRRLHLNLIELIAKSPQTPAPN